MENKGLSVSQWREAILAHPSGMLQKDVESVASRYEHLISCEPFQSLDIGAAPSQWLQQALDKHVPDSQYRMLGQMAEGLMILRARGSMEISFDIVQVKDGDCSVVKSIPWSLDIFMRNVSCIMPHPDEMDFPVYVSCGGCYAVFVGPATRLRVPGDAKSYYPTTKLFTAETRDLQEIEFGSDAWPVNLAFHPRHDQVLAVLLRHSPTWHCPAPHFSHSPTTLTLYNVAACQVTHTLTDPLLSPALLAFTADGAEVVALTAMRVEQYAVASVADGNQCDLVFVDACSQTVTSSLPAGTPDEALKVTGRISTPELCDWLNRQTREHISQSRRLSAVTSLDRKRVHVMCFTTMTSAVGGQGQVYSYCREKGSTVQMTSGACGSGMQSYLDTLLGLCRACVLQWVKIGDIEQLPLPRDLHQYLMGCPRFK